MQFIAVTMKSNSSGCLQMMIDIVFSSFKKFSCFPFLLPECRAFILLNPCFIDEGTNGFAAQNSFSGAADTGNTSVDGIELAYSFYVPIMISSLVGRDSKYDIYIYSVIGSIMIYFV